MHSLEIIEVVNRKGKLVYEASKYHEQGKSIPVKLFEALCAVGETPTLLWREFNDAEGTNVPLYPLNTEEN